MTEVDIAIAAGKSVIAYDQQQNSLAVVRVADS